MEILNGDFVWQFWLGIQHVDFEWGYKLAILNREFKRGI